MTESLARVSPIPATHDAMADLLRSFSELRRQNARAIAQVAAENGINSTDLRALSFVWGSDGATPKATAEHLGITTGSLTTLADRLVKVDLLERTAHPDDRRSVILRPTEKGARVMTDANRAYLDAFADAFEPEDAPWISHAFRELAAALGRLVD